MWTIQCRVRRGDGYRSHVLSPFLGLHERQGFHPQMPFGTNRIRCVRDHWARESRVNMGTKVSVDLMRIRQVTEQFASRHGNAPTSEFVFMQFRSLRRVSNQVGSTE